MSNKKTIGSLISVPEVETVIRLDIADSEDEQGSRNLLSSFVITDEIERSFQQFFHKALNRHGGAAFLRGNYGSGKSHFLAVLSLLLESTQLWEYINYPGLQEFRRLSGQKILVVKIALHNFSSGESLESILFGETEKTLQQKTGKTVLLRRGAMLVEHFTRYILPQHPEFLREIKLSRSEWTNRSQQQPQEAIQQVYSFIQNNRLPLRVVFDRREALEILYRESAAAGYDGIFWALDELSEFLKAKPSSALFTEDLRFLQFLGEACAGDNDMKNALPVYLIAALQENIEKTGYIEKDLVYRIKDRFPLRFSLSAHHVNQLIARRLIRKKSGAEAHIQTIYRSFVTAFPQAEIEENDFVAIYPIHPDTVQLLEGLTPIFSQHRGVVDFIYHQLTGDDNRGWPGMLTLPATQLMTPDSIFDHFRDRLREIPELAPYVDVVFQTVQKDIDRLFDSPEDRLLAARAVKILILNELNLVKKTATVQRLSQMLNQPVSDLDESLNTGYLKEVILEKLVQEGSFVAKKAQDSGEFVYFISMEMTVHQMVRTRVQEFFSQPVKMEQELKDLFGLLQNALIPFAALSNGKRRRSGFDWQNTHREGWVIFKPQPRWEGGELDELNRGLLSSEQDFVLFIIGSEQNSWPQPPQFPSGLFQNSFAGSILAWAPRPFQIAETEFLRRFRAYEMVNRQLGGSVSPQEKQMRQIVTDWLEAHQNEFATIVEDVYLHGRIADTRGWRDFKFAPFYADFKTILKQIFSPVLQEAYPRHSEIMPGDVMSSFVAERLFLQFIKPGAISREEARSQNVDQLIETYLKPLGIIASDQDRYNLSLADDGNGLLSHFLRECTGENPVSLYSLYWRFRKGEWGMSRGQFQLLLGALLAAGRLTAFLAGNAVPFRNIAQFDDGSIEAVGEGKLISEVVQQALKPFLQLNRFQSVSPHFSISTQEQFWRLLKEFKNEVRSLLERWYSLSRRYESYPAYQQVVDPEELDLPLLEEFCDNIRVSFAAREGLEKLVEQIGAARIQQVPEWFLHLRGMVAIVENRFVELNQIYVYLQHPLLNKAVADSRIDLAQQVEDVLRAFQSFNFTEEAHANEIAEKFYRFQSDYAKRYQKAHQAYYGDARFQQTRQMETDPVVQILKRLHRIEAIACSPDWVTIQQEIASLQKPCRRNPERRLVNAPVCECGFVPGQEMPVTEGEEIHTRTVTGVISGVSQLQETFRWILEEYIANLRRIGKPDLGTMLENLLRFPVKQVDKQAGQLLSILSDEVIAEINAAIRGKVLILQRPIKKLQQELSGKQMPLRQIRKIVDNWLTGGEAVPDDTFIHILSEQEFPPLEEQQYQSFKNQIREDGPRYFEAFYLLGWAVAQDVPEWLDWVQNKFRIQKIDAGEIRQKMGYFLETGDIDRMAIHFQQAGILHQLIKLIDLPQKTVSQLIDYSHREIFWEPLSALAARQLLLKIAPTEGLPPQAAGFAGELDRHPRKSQWPHLQFLHNYFDLLQITGDGENAANLIAFFLNRGWRLPLLIDGAVAENRTLHLVADERMQSLQKRVAGLLRQLTFPQKKIPKKELPLPYRKIDHISGRMRELIGEGNESLIVVIVDAMRWDIWENLRPLFISWFEPRTLRLFEAMEVESPTTTETNRQKIIEKIVDTAGAPDWKLEVMAEDPTRSAEIVRLINSREPLLFLNTTLVDTLLHERKEPLTSMLAVMKERMQALLEPVLLRIPADVPVLVTADHGFTETAEGYGHGGDSFFEKIVPFAVWQ